MRLPHEPLAELFLVRSGIVSRFTIGTPLREVIWLDDMPVALFTPGATASAAPVLYDIHTDHLNTPRAVMDTAGNLRWRWIADPFGTAVPETNPAGLGAFVQNLRFPGQVADGETGLFYNTARFYDPMIGRYVESDPIGLGGGINTYAYVNGNPLSATDSRGLQSTPVPGLPFPIPLPGSDLQKQLSDPLERIIRSLTEDDDDDFKTY